MSNNQPNLKPNDGTEEEILSPNSLHVPPPTLPSIDIVVGDPISKQFPPSDIPIQTAARTVCRVRMKFKDCGVQGNRYLFICASNVALYPEDLLPDMLAL